MLYALAEAIGTGGMAGGQAMDLEATRQPTDAASIEQMHRLKTGALIRASVELGALGAARHRSGHPRSPAPIRR